MGHLEPYQALINKFLQKDINNKIIIYRRSGKSKIKKYIKMWKNANPEIEIGSFLQSKIDEALSSPDKFTKERFEYEGYGLTTKKN
jgi:predicted DNA binding CopG/RHH family protein